MDVNYRLWLDAEEFLNREEARLLKTYNCKTIEEVIVKLKAENKRLREQ